MTARRHLLLTALALPFAARLVRPAAAQGAATQQAQEFVRQLTSQIIAIINSPGSNADKQARIRPLVDASVDVDGIARFCLGRFWRSASPAQQQDYLHLFHDVLLNAITGRLGEYQSVKLTIGHAEQRDAGIVVSSTLERPNNPPSQVDWVVEQAPGGMKVIDVVAAGTSMRLTQRSDYSSFISRNGDSVQPLLEALHKQVAAGPAAS